VVFSLQTSAFDVAESAPLAGTTKTQLEGGMQEARRALVAGGAGFIGSNLCKRLISEGTRVDCVDNLITGRLSAVQGLRKNPKFRFLRLDITEPSFASTVMSRRYDDIYHLACPTGVPNIRIHGEEMIRTCSIGTENILRVASAHNASMIFASSAEVYGDPEQFPQHETYGGNVDPIGPRSAYEEGKRFGESLTRLYAEKYHLNAKIVRIFNTFGVGMRIDDTRVIPSFLRCLRNGEDFTVYGDGKQTRTHLYVSDLLDGIGAVNHNGQRGEAYNLGGENELCILDLVEIIRTITSAPVSIKHKSHFIEDHGGRRPKIDKAKKLGWNPTTTVSEGLRKMMRQQDLPCVALKAEPAPKQREGSLAERSLVVSGLTD
jgi:nucleoside-diphosphate-sugar epimerase